jgi:mRNA interferase YafQ
MKQLRYSTQYKKDFKRYKNQPKKLKKLLEIFKMLENGKELPKEFKPHKLAGQYKDCMECHVEGDFLLIWFDANSDFIEILRIGTHSELFF